MSSSDLNWLESEVVRKLLCGDSQLLHELRAAALLLEVQRREWTEVGFYTYFRVQSTRSAESAKGRIVWGDVLADVGGLLSPVGFLIYIENGQIAMLEGYSTAGESLPRQIELFTLRYSSEPRDLSELLGAGVR